MTSAPSPTSTRTQALPAVLSHTAFQVPDESIELCVSPSSVTPSLILHTEPKLVPWTITLKKCAAFGADRPADDGHLILCLDPGVPVVDYALQTLVRSYKTLYVFSPKLGRDIITQPISSACESPIQVILDGVDILEEGYYHLQVWLTGSSRRKSHSLTCTSPPTCSVPKASCEHLHRLEYCEKVLMALRQDTNSTDVSILISEDKHTIDPTLGVGEHGERMQGRDGGTVEEPPEVGSQEISAVGNTGAARPQKNTFKPNARQSSEVQQDASTKEGNAIENRLRFIPRRREARRVDRSLKAHKVVLDVNPYFYRMLNCGFKESQPTTDHADDTSNSRSTFNIVLPSKLFPVAIMDCLLDYIYCLKPFPEYDYPEPTSPTLIESPVEQVALQSPGEIFESSHDPQSQPFFLGLNEWGALYRVGQVLEIQELELMALQRIRSFLDVDTVMDEFMDWGYRHEAVKAIMMDFLVQKRRAVFGSEANNHLRPYLYADYNDQVDTLVQLTSRIARN